MIFPRKLKDNSSIGVTAVSMGCIDETDILRLENAHKNLRKKGFNIIETKNVRTNRKLESSPAKERANQFMELIKNDKVDYIVAVSGGEILFDMLPYLDFDEISKCRPKWIQGYSDPSLLNFIMTTKMNIATINGVNYKSFGMEPFHETILKNIDFLEAPETLVQDSFDMFEGARVETDNPYSGFFLNEKVLYKSLYNKEETIKGRVIGGCIDVISKIVGTKFDNTVEFCKKFPEGMLWYIDNCELNIAEFYRVMWQLKEANWFNNANGFLIGRTGVSKTMFDFDYLDSLHKIFDDLKVPVFYDVDIGHLPPQWIMINGSLGEFIFDNGKGRLVQKMI